MSDHWTCVIDTAKGRVLISSSEKVAAEWREYGQNSFSAKAFDTLFTNFPKLRCDVQVKSKQ